MTLSEWTYDASTFASFHFFSLTVPVACTDSVCNHKDSELHVDTIYSALCFSSPRPSVTRSTLPILRHNMIPLIKALSRARKPLFLSFCRCTLVILSPLAVYPLFHNIACYFVSYVLWASCVVFCHLFADGVQGPHRTGHYLFNNTMSPSDERSTDIAMCTHPFVGWSWLCVLGDGSTSSLVTCHLIHPYRGRIGVHYDHIDQRSHGVTL